MARKKGNSGGFALGLVVGLVFGLVLTLAGVWAYFKWAKPGVEQSNKPPASVVAMNPSGPPPIVKRPAHAVKTPPFGISEDVFESGAHLYSARCASCHGVPGRDARAANGHPARQLWKRNGSAVGVSDQQAGSIYEKVSSGELKNGMPAFEGQLSETQIWQVSLLLKSADQQMPDPVTAILKEARIPQ